MHFRTLTLAVALVTLGGGVAACSRSSGMGGTAANPQQATTISVVNQAYLDMDVYVVRQGGQRIRLGTATGNQTTVLTIPSDVLFGPTPLRFIADPIGGTHAEVSTSILVNAGDQVEMRIPPG
jgi:hypothetical protein